MKQNIQELLNELVSYTEVLTSTISSQARSVLIQMRIEFHRLAASNDPDKQKKMIAAFMGGTIFALKQDDWKYQYKDCKLYPSAVSKDVLKKLNGANSTLENMYAIGYQALLYLPHSFNGELFKIEGNLIDTKVPTAFFPNLQKNANKVNLLVKFCIKHSNDLECAQVDTNDLSAVDLPESASKSNKAEIKTDKPEIKTDKRDAKEINTSSSQSSFSDISMQILGGFLAALGAAAVAVAFVALNAATFGVAGLITAGSGAAAILSGVGLFGIGAYRSCQSTPDESLANTISPVAI